MGPLANVLQEFIDTLTGGIELMATGIGGGVNTFMGELFIETTQTGDLALTTFGGAVAIFGGVALAVGLTKLLFNWVRSMGNR